MPVKNQFKGPAFFSALICSLILLSSCNPQAKKEEAVKVSKALAVQNYVSSLSDAAKISQLFLVNIEGNTDFHAVEKTGSLYGKSREGEPLVPGGCLFFSYNIGKTPQEIKSFITSIQNFYAQNGYPPPYTAVDQEGGYVNRLRGITEKFPAAKEIASTMSTEQAAILYEKQAAGMKDLGFNMNLAPVVEVETEENAAFLDTRSFGNLEKVLSYGQTEINIFENQKVGTVLKHFPGNTNTDPHTGLPEIKVTERQLEEQFMAPFKALLPLSSAVLMSHARIEVIDAAPDRSFDSKTPAGLSKYWVTDVVRNQFGFEGLILSDDIFMGALQANGFPPEAAAVQAIDAGIDVIMLSEKRFGEAAAILLKKAGESEEFASKIDRAAAHVIQYKIKAGLLKYEEILNDESPSSKKTSVPQFKVVPAGEF